MRQTRFIRRARTGCQNAEVCVDLHTVGIDYDAVELFCDREREGRFAARGRPSYD